jgi:hypothetical protein
LLVIERKQVLEAAAVRQHDDIHIRRLSLSSAEEEADRDRCDDRGRHDDADPREELKCCLHRRSLDPPSDGMGIKCLHLR